jgi:drug/metabolite transporter (DMT)-like permease
MFVILLIFGFSFNRTLLLAVGIGFANGFGTYCQWRAIDLSLSKSSLFSWGSAFIAVVLGYLLLNERAAINLMMASGLMLSFISAALLAIREYRAQKKDEGDEGVSVYLWIAGYTVIWGVIGFLMRVFAIDGVGTATFLGGWYFGSFLVGLVLLAPLWGRRERTFSSFTLRDGLLSTALAVVIVVNLGREYWVYHYLPIIVAQPLFLILGTVSPALIGLFYFKEGRRFSWQEWTLYSLGALGAVLVIAGFVGV